VLQSPSDKSAQASSIPERLRAIRERLGTEQIQKLEPNKQANRLAQWGKH
jgi:hypothetical protein